MPSLPAPPPPTHQRAQWGGTLPVLAMRLKALVARVSCAGVPKFRWMWSCAQPRALAVVTTWSMKPAGPHAYNRLSGLGLPTRRRCQFLLGGACIKVKVGVGRNRRCGNFGGKRRVRSAERVTRGAAQSRPGARQPDGHAQQRRHIIPPTQQQRALCEGCSAKWLRGVLMMVIVALVHAVMHGDGAAAPIAGSRNAAMR